MKQKTKHSDNIRILFAVGGAFIWIIISAYLFAVVRNPLKAQGKENYRPHVDIDVKRKPQPGDTLYVIAVRNDSVFLYGK